MVNLMSHKVDLMKNPIGGLNDMRNDALKRAQQADLVTLPPNVRGTNCFNCKFLKDRVPSHGYCSNHQVAQVVNSRMCCALWDAQGTYRPFKKQI
jgi:hypothetical protein